MIGTAHESLVNTVRYDDAAERHRAIVHALGEGDDVGHDVVALRGEAVSNTAEGGDHFVEDQHESVLVAESAQPFQIVLRRSKHARRAGKRLDDHRCNRLGAVQRDERFKRVRV